MNKTPFLPPITGKKPAPPMTNPPKFTPMTFPTPLIPSPTPMRASPSQQIPTQTVLAPIHTIKSDDRVTYYPSTNPDHRPKITRPKTANKQRGRPPIGGTKTKRKTNKRKNNKTNKRKNNKTKKRKPNKKYK
jgi:hypothetical protein